MEESAAKKQKPNPIGCHDLGCVEIKEIDGVTEQSFYQWEKETEAMMTLIRAKYPPGLHGFRRYIESMEPAVYQNASYYERWIYASTQLCLDMGLFTNQELGEELGDTTPSTHPVFKVGDYVRVREEDLKTRWRKPHLRAPGYIHGKVGVVERLLWEAENPELCAFGVEGPKQMMYRIRFPQSALWEKYHGNDEDTIDVEVYHHWLSPATKDDHQTQIEEMKKAREHSHDDDHATHDHGDHTHESRVKVEAEAVQKEAPNGPFQLLFTALKKLLLQKGVFTTQDIQAKIDQFEMTLHTGHRNGAKICAKAWVDPEFKKRLLADATKAIKEDFDLQPGQGAGLVVPENTDDTHNLIVCTLCSCYPSYLLGKAPSWYKSRNYRARGVYEPRKLLKEFGTDLPDSVKVQVHDSTADQRYMVLPKRPKGTEGWTEEQLANIITRNSLVGVSVLPDQL